jgi:hypothetical protein
VRERRQLVLQAWIAGVSDHCGVVGGEDLGVRWSAVMGGGRGSGNRERGERSDYRSDHGCGSFSVEAAAVGRQGEGDELGDDK